MMVLEGFDKSNYDNKLNSHSSIDDILLTLKYPELIDEKYYTPEIDLKKENIALEKDITKWVKENDKFSFRRHMELLAQEKNADYNLRYRPTITGNKLGKLVFKTAEGSMNMWFQTIIRREETGIICNFDFTPHDISIDKKISLLKKLHKLINEKLGL